MARPRLLRAFVELTQDVAFEIMKLVAIGEEFKADTDKLLGSFLVVPFHRAAGRIA